MTGRQLSNLELKAEECDNNEGEQLQADTTEGRGNVHPGIPSDERDPLLSIFPLEIWHKILEEISDPTTLENINNSCGLFRSILLQSRVQFLFRSVWDIFEGKYNESLWKDSINTDKFPFEVPENTLPYDDQIQIRSNVIDNMRLRLVCRAWCHALDNWYENHHIHYKTEQDRNSYDNEAERVIQQSFEIDRQYILAAFKSHLNATHSSAAEDGLAIRNPFWGRSMAVEIQDKRGRPQDARFLAGVRAILVKYGRYVWHCSLIDYSHYSHFATRMESYATIKSILDLTPNLRTLEYRLLGTTCPPHRYNPTASPQEISEMQAYIMAHPLPTFQHMEFLQVKSIHLTPTFFDELLRSCRHATMLRIDAYSGHEGYNISTTTIPNLKQLSLVLHSEVEFETFFSRNVNWPLTKLDLDVFMAHTSGSFIEWSRLFAALRNNLHHTSLDTLRINLPRAKTEEDVNRLLRLGGDLRLGLPHVKHVNLNIYNYTCLDFLLPMKNTLETIDIRFCVKADNEDQLDLVDNIEDGKEIRLLRCLERPWNGMDMECNIWTIFPNVGHVRFRFFESTNASIVRRSFPRMIQWVQKRTTK